MQFSSIFLNFSSMKILSIPQVREADQYTIEHEPIASIDLMERAATQLFNWIAGRYPDDIEFHIICGPGNNGGDGLVLARLLLEKGFKARTSIIWFTEKGSEDFRVNLDRLKKIKGAEVNDIVEDKKAGINEGEVLVDAIFGSGLSRPVEGLPADIIKAMNESGNPILAIDSPSGLFSDKPTDPKAGEVIRSIHTLTFQFPKLAFLFPENQDFVGDFTVLPIGLHPEYIDRADSKQHFILAADAANILKDRKKFDHKGTFGHALLVAGNTGKMGAAILAAEACLRSGPGLVTLSLPHEGIPILQTAVPEAMVFQRPTDYQFVAIKNIGTFSGIAAGPGLGTEEPTANALKFLIQSSGIPLVLDADALNILSENKTWLAFLPKGSILTPHPREFERLAGKSSDSFERLELLKEFCIRFGVYVILKGAHSCTCTPDGVVYFNSTGNPGMATGGSGDALTGILAGLMAQGYTPLQSALLGTYIHGLAADLALEGSSWEGIVPTDLIAHLGEAFSLLREERKQ